MVHEDESKEDLPAHFVDADAAVVQPVEQLFELEVVEPQRLVDSNSDTAAERRSGDDEYTRSRRTTQTIAPMSWRLRILATYCRRTLLRVPPWRHETALQSARAGRTTRKTRTRQRHESARSAFDGNANPLSLPRLSLQSSVRTSTQPFRQPTQPPLQRNHACSDLPSRNAWQ